MSVEYETVSARMRAQGWVAGADRVDKFVGKLRQRGKLPLASEPESEDRFFPHPQFDLDRMTREVAVRQFGTPRVVRLEPQEFKIFDLLCRHLDELLTREQVMQEVWPYSGGNDHVLRMHVYNLRHKLGINPGIETVRKVGYILRSTSDNGQRAGH